MFCAAVTLGWAVQRRPVPRAAPDRDGVGAGHPSCAWRPADGFGLQADAAAERGQGSLAGRVPPRQPRAAERAHQLVRCSGTRRQLRRRLPLERRWQVRLLTGDLAVITCGAAVADSRCGFGPLILDLYLLSVVAELGMVIMTLGWSTHYCTQMQALNGSKEGQPGAPERTACGGG